MSVTFYATWAGDHGTTMFGGDDFSLSNTNARALLTLLALNPDADLGGEIGPADLMNRIAVARIEALTVAGDEHGTPSVEDGGPGTGRARWVECGRRPGYFADRLDGLEAVAAEAAEHGGLVNWA